MAVDNAKPAILAKTLGAKECCESLRNAISSAKRLVRKGLGCARIRVPHEPLISNSQVESNQRSASTSACIGYPDMVPSCERFE